MDWRSKVKINFDCQLQRAENSNCGDSLSHDEITVAWAADRETAGERWWIKGNVKFSPRAPCSKRYRRAPMNSKAAEQKGKVASFVTPGVTVSRAYRVRGKLARWRNSVTAPAIAPTEERRISSAEGQWEKGGDAFLGRALRHKVPACIAIFGEVGKNFQ